MKKGELLYLAVCAGYGCGCVMVQDDFFKESFWTHNPEVVEKCPKDIEKKRCPECSGDDSFPIRD